MAPAVKRKAPDNDFIFTLSDNEADLYEAEEAAVAPPPKKKAKTKAKQNKKNRKNTSVGIEAAASDTDKEEVGLWGKNDDDDGAMDSEFEFMPDETGAVDQDFDGWGFEGAKGIDPEKRGVDIDDIIRRRREKGDKTEVEVVDELNEDMHEIDLDDADDQVLANDAFGMAIASGGKDEHEDGPDDEEDDEEEDEEEDDDGSEASHQPHPDDKREDSIASDGGHDAEEEEEEEEEARRKEFFAPEEQETSLKTTISKSFQDMSLSRPILRGLAAIGFARPTPIQAKTIPIALLGKDVVGGAVTGSGKTAAFVVPILERLLYRPKKVATSRVVILTPTRELAMQCHAVATKLAAYSDIKFSLAVGGLSLKVQEAELRLRPDVIIATPGRFIDHMRNSMSFSVDAIEILVLDEADRMLEDGFADELNEIITTLPKSRQTMLFSATMTSSVDNLIRLGLNKPVRIMVDSQKKTVGTLIQEFVRLRPGREEKRMGYLLQLCKKLYSERTIIFFRQKKDAHRARIIFALLGLSCAELHGSMTQTQRIASVEAFRDAKVSFLLATDLASRGLDIKGVNTVINYEAPQKLDIYVHRVGRTARAGRAGVACTLAAEPDRKVVKAAVKAGKAQGAKILSRVIEAAEADNWQAKVDQLQDEITAVMREEKEERQLAMAEMQVKKGQNLMEHEAEIKARPRRTWFETERDKKKAKEAGLEELNGLREELKRKHNGKLSNKDKKKLDSKAERTGTNGGAKVWKKGAAERSGKGVLAGSNKGQAKPRGIKGRPAGITK